MLQRFRDRLVHCLLVSLVVVIGGCNDREATALAPIVAIEPALVGLVDSCSSLVGGTQSATIGKDGGVIAVGPDTLIIPSGALARSTMITATIPTGSSVNVVAFQPDGLKFKKAVTLALSYAACGSLTGSVTIAQVDDSMHIITYLKTKTNRVTRQVTGQLQHFSNYALAY